MTCVTWGAGGSFIKYRDNWVMMAVLEVGTIVLTISLKAVAWLSTISYALGSCVTVRHSFEEEIDTIFYLCV